MQSRGKINKSTAGLDAEMELLRGRAELPTFCGIIALADGLKSNPHEPWLRF